MQLNIFRKIRSWLSTRSAGFYYAVLGVVSFSLILPLQTQAGVFGKLGGFILRNLLWIFYFIFIACMGKIATLGMKLVIWTATFSNLTTMPAVNETWKVVRDFSNLFFLVVLLLIAFGTMLKIESYSYKKLLPKMIIAAVLINFSKLICSVLVDAAQIIMLTFVNAFKGAAQQGLYYAFRMNELVSLDTAGFDIKTGAGEETWTELDYFVAAVAAGAMITFMAVLMLTFAVILCARVVFIWTLTILSPLAFATSILPATQKYSQQWWSTFGRYVAVGPFLAFFIWLALFVVIKAGDAGVSGQLSISSGTTSHTEGSTATFTQPTQGYAGRALDPSVVVNYLIATMMLLIGLQFSQQMATEIGSLTQKAGNLPKAFTKFYANRVVKDVAGKGLADRIYAGTGIDLNLARQWELIKKKSQEMSAKRVSSGRTKALSAVAKGSPFHMLGAADYAFEMYMPKILGGRQGIIGGNRGLLRSPITQAFHARAKGRERDAELERGALISKDEKLSRYGIDTEKYDQEMEFREREASLDATSESRGTIDREHALQVMSLLRTAQAVEKDPAKQQNIQKTIDRMQQEYDSGAKTFSLDGEMQGHIRVSVEEKKKSIDKEREDLGLKPRGDATDNEKKLIEDKQLAITAFEAANRKNLTAIETKRKRASEEASKTAPIFDREMVRHVEELLSGYKKDLYGINNEDELKDLLVQYARTNDTWRFAATAQHMAEVGHGNEITQPFHINSNGQGMKKLAEELMAKGGHGLTVRGQTFKNMGLDRQIVLSIFGDISRECKKNNHWPYAELIGSRHGQRYWRGEAEQQERISVEISKMGLPEYIRRGNRLALGGYHVADESGRQEWSGPMVGAIKALVGGLNALGPSLAHGLIGTSNVLGHFEKQPYYRTMLLQAFDRAGDSAGKKIAKRLYIPKTKKEGEEAPAPRQGRRTRRAQ